MDKTLQSNPTARLSLRQIEQLCQRVKEYLLPMDNVISLPAPVVVCGDIHGQFEDLMTLFDKGGSVQENTYLFLGDYVDRGKNSVAVIVYLFELMLKGRVFLLRGNHECRVISQGYGFYDECIAKFGDARAWRLFMDVFDYLPLAAVVDQNAFCCHGGLSSYADTIAEINAEDRFQETPTEGLQCDLCWSDPSESETGEFEPNERGAGWYFGGRATDKFLHANRLDFIFRAHQMKQGGFSFHQNSRVLTLFSAPGYAYHATNEAAILRCQQCSKRGVKDGICTFAARRGPRDEDPAGAASSSRDVTI